MNGLALVDASNLVFSQCLNYHRETKDQPDLQMIRILVLEELIKHRSRLKKDYQEWVMCYDGQKYWRKDIFPYYKGRRQEDREKSDFDWDGFFPLYEQFKQELKENFPIKCLQVHGAEGDDLIASLCKVYGPHRDICILSSDKDFIQIQQTIAPKVKQWSLYHGKWLTPKNSEYDLLEHIIRGDTDDGVPNILSDGDTFMVKGKRQKSVFAKWVEECSQYGLASPEKFCKTHQALENFERNRKLIDLREIPEDLTQKIVAEYETLETPSGKAYNYMVGHRLTRLMEAGGF